MSAKKFRRILQQNFFLALRLCLQNQCTDNPFRFGNKVVKKSEDVTNNDKKPKKSTKNRSKTKLKRFDKLPNQKQLVVDFSLIS